MRPAAGGGRTGKVLPPDRASGGKALLAALDGPAVALPGPPGGPQAAVSLAISSVRFHPGRLPAQVSALTTAAADIQPGPIATRLGQLTEV